MTTARRHEMPRTAGILLHPSSLPGDYGIGDLGKGARAFVDWLESAGASLWQILPLVPTDGWGSPYSSWSAFAGNPDLIDIAELVEIGLLSPSEARRHEAPGAVDYGAMRELRRPMLARAVTTLSDSKHPTLGPQFAEFRATAAWVEETAMFAALKKHHRGPWWEWPAALRDRNADALAAARRTLTPEVDEALGLQFLFDRQWRALRRYANAKGVQLIGDIPIHVDADSVDVWANRELFELGNDGRPARVAGVPPDAFSATGQHWGNPLYRWDRMAQDGYAWWRSRLRRALTLTDWVRIDHFRGLASYWAIPATAPDARLGEWCAGPGVAFFKALSEVTLELPIIAEDLGDIDDDVRQLLKTTGLPGMAVLHFAFGGDARNLYLPHNHDANSVVYTGTHDNNTSRGWWQSAPDHVRDHVRHYFATDGHDIVWDLIRAALASVARFAVVPLQDVLGLGSEARMNTPATTTGNWCWRMDATALRPELATRFRFLAGLYDRLPGAR